MEKSLVVRQMLVTTFSNTFKQKSSRPKLQISSWKIARRQNSRWDLNRHQTVNRVVEPSILNRRHTFDRRWILNRRRTFNPWRIINRHRAKLKKFTVFSFENSFPRHIGVISDKLSLQCQRFKSKNIPPMFWHQSVSNNEVGVGIASVKWQSWPK